MCVKAESANVFTIPYFSNFYSSLSKSTSLKIDLYAKLIDL